MVWKSDEKRFIVFDILLKHGAIEKKCSEHFRVLHSFNYMLFSIVHTNSKACYVNKQKKTRHFLLPEEKKPGAAQFIAHVQEGCENQEV